MLSFHNDPALKAQLLSNLHAHAKKDAFRQDEYWDADTSRGCAVGCSIIDFGGDPEEHTEYERLFGIPEALAQIEDGIFENLPLAEAKALPIAFIEAIPVGVDLSTIVDRLVVAWIQSTNTRDCPKVKALCDMIECEIAGGSVTRDEWFTCAQGPSSHGYAQAYAYVRDMDHFNSCGKAARAHAHSYAFRNLVLPSTPAYAETLLKVLRAAT
jgi:hypothetical protein